MNYLGSLAAKFRRVFGAKPIGDIFGFVGTVHHDEEDWLFLQRFQLVPVFAPPFDTRRQVGPVADACHVGLCLRNLCDSFHGAFDDAVDDGLLQRVIGNRPGENGAFLEPRSCRKIEFRGKVEGS